MKPAARIANTYCRRIVAVAAVVISFLLVLPGCGIPQLRGPAPAAGLPPTYNVPPGFEGADSFENSAQIGISEFFNDPKLESLIDQALIGNQNLRILAENIQIANNEVRRRRGAYLPFVTGGASAAVAKPSLYTPQGAVESQLTYPGGNNFPSPLPDYLTAANITWQVDIWRQLRNARDAQIFRYFGTIDGWNYVVTRLVAEVAENYYQLMALDKRLENLDRTIALQEQSLAISKRRKEMARGNELAVQRFLAEVRRNQSEKLIIYQEIIEVENRINFLLGRYPQPVERDSTRFFDLTLGQLRVGLPSQLLLNRPDIREAERELAAAGLDIRVARANFFPKMFINAGVGYEAFNPKYLFITPESLIYSVAGDLIVPLINKSAIRADYLNANAKQLQALYNYQRTILNAFTEVVNRVNRVYNYSNSITIKEQQLSALETAVSVANNLFVNARVEYIDVLFSQRDMRDARTVLIDTKQEQLAAIVNAYQALGGGLAPNSGRLLPAPNPPESIPAPPPVEDEQPAEAVQGVPAPGVIEPAEPLPKPAPDAP